MLKILILTIVATFVITLTPATQVYAASSIGRIVHTYGPAWVQRGATRERATKGQIVLRNDSIVTSARGRVKIIMGDGSKVYIGAKSRISLRKYAMQGGKLLHARINMLWGKVRFFVNTLSSRNSTFRVRTPTAVLGVRGTEFIVIVPPTPEVLDLAFADITLADMPPLPTNTVLSEGAVDVSFGEAGEIERLLPGHTAQVGKNGKITIKETQKGDAEIKNVEPSKGNFEQMDQSSERGKPSKEGVSDFQTKLNKRSKAPDLPKRPIKQDVGDAIKANINDIPTEIVNVIQNLEDTTEIIIQPSFVAPN